ncbi:LexA family protein [Streptomyces sp. NPDC008092]|uniref:LexA family protein n=1 Tax=Streptomyces sp. NPDC008092 TaxID=3364808 RepID=UPI0036EC07BD
MPNDCEPTAAPAANTEQESTPPVHRGLHDRQPQIINLLREADQRQGFPPTLREIGAAVGLSSPASVVYHLDQLEKRGLVKKSASGRFRGHRVLTETFAEEGQRVTVIGCPLLDSSHAVVPDEAERAVLLKVLLDGHSIGALRAGAHLTVQLLPVTASDAPLADAVVLGQVVGVTHPVSGPRLSSSER